MTASSLIAPRLIVGLGNPGRDYEETRHNAGFWFCARLAQKWGASLAMESRFHGIVGRGAQGVWMVLPQTFMNRSGQSVGALARFHRIDPAEILVVHDELDIPPGQLRLKFGGGMGGHNGLKDITSHLGHAGLLAAAHRHWPSGRSQRSRELRFEAAASRRADRYRACN